MPLDNKILQRLRDNDATLTWLYLFNDKIIAEDVKALAKVLEKNTTLTSLNLGHNEIGVEGAKALVAALEKNTFLTSVILYDSQIANAIKRQIAHLEKRNLQFLGAVRRAASSQLKVGRVLLYKTTEAEPGRCLLSTLPLEIREEIVKHVDAKNGSLMTNEQQRLVLNYAEGKIAPVADKHSFFEVTRCDRLRKQLREDVIRTAEQRLNQSLFF